MDIIGFCKKYGIKDKDVVDAIQTIYPKYDKYLHSKVKRADIYGVGLSRAAETLLKQKYARPSAPHSQKSAGDRRIIRVPIPQPIYDRLQQALNENQETLRDFILNIIEKNLGGENDVGK